MTKLSDLELIPKELDHGGLERIKRYFLGEKSDLATYGKWSRKPGFKEAVKLFNHISYLETQVDELKKSHGKN